MTLVELRPRLIIPDVAWTGVGSLLPGVEEQEWAGGSNQQCLKFSFVILLAWVLLSDGMLPLGALDVAVAERLPRAIVHSVTARSDLEDFVVYVIRGRKIEQFSLPPDGSPLFPVIHEVVGEREPERILAALGIPKEWFHL